MNKQTMKQKRAQFIKLYSAGVLGQNQIANKLGVSQQSVCKWAKDIKHKQAATNETAAALLEIRNALITEAKHLTESISTNGTAEKLHTMLFCLAILETLITKK